MNKIYNPKLAQKEIQQARWQLFQRFAIAVSLWTSIVLIFGSLLMLLIP